MAEGFQELAESLILLLNEISSLGDYVKSHRKDCTNLARRLKLLAPLLEEARETKGPFTETFLSPFYKLKDVLQSSKELLSQCNKGSKIFLMLKKDEITCKFQTVTSELEHVLDCLPYNSLNLSEEVREQVELLHAQLKRAKARAETVDNEVYMDLMTVLACSKEDQATDRITAERLAGKLQLRTLSELKEESRALQNMIMDNGGDIDDAIDNVCAVLRKLKSVAVDDTEEPRGDRACFDMTIRSALSPTPRSDKASHNPAIPEDFRCPISLDLMKDPVIVATGQTYERSCIQRWLDAGHKTCPITQQTLPHLVLTPNYVLRSLIHQWCESNGIELPKKVGTSRAGNGEVEASGDRATVEVLLQQLSSSQVDVQRAAVADLRLLAKRSIENRVCIADAGGIPLLIELLSSTDARIQEHAVTALLNLSIHDQNKGQIVQAGAINPIVEVLRSGSMEARENAAATLFSLSVVDDNKVTIGQTGAIPALVDLLKEGTARGKKDAATALFNLSIYQGNKAKAVRAGVVPPLMELLDPSAGMVDEALAILAILATHQEGRVAIGQETTIPLLVELIRSGSPRNKENAAAVLLALGQNDPAHLLTAKHFDASAPLLELVQSGTSRARRKASLILELMNNLQAPSS